MHCNPSTPCAPAIGCIDSGLGGLSILNALTNALPQHDFVYIADSQWCPYGTKDPKVLQSRLCQLTQWLIERGAELIVLACNSATISTIASLRAQFSVPFVGVEPGIKLAIPLSTLGAVAVLATDVSLAGGKYQRLKQEYQGNTRLIQRSCPELVTLLENGDIQGAKARQAVKRITDELRAQQVDVIILGCTHYVFFKPLFEEIAEGQLHIIDVAAAVAQQTVRLAPQHSRGALSLFTSGCADTLEQHARALLHAPSRTPHYSQLPESLK